MISVALVEHLVAVEGICSNKCQWVPIPKVNVAVFELLYRGLSIHIVRCTFRGSVTMHVHYAFMIREAAFSPLKVSFLCT